MIKFFLCLLIIALKNSRSIAKITLRSMRKHIVGQRTVSGDVTNSLESELFFTLLIAVLILHKNDFYCLG